MYKFLIYISYPYALPIGKPLEQEIEKRGFRVLWFSDEKDGKRALKKKENTLTTVQELINYQPDVVLAIANEVPDFITGLKVQIFHGFNAEKRPSAKDGFSHFRIRGFFDLYCTQGPSTTKIFEQQQKKYPHFEVVETGWAKMDPLFPVKENRNHQPPVILISSTFTQRLSLAYRTDVFTSIQELSKTGRYHFLMVLHPIIPQVIKEKWKSLEEKHFHFLDTTDLIPLFKEADLMFADTTSAIQEFGLQERPIVTFNHTFEKPYLINITKVEDIEPAFKKALKYPQKIIQNLATYNKKLHPYSDGQSSKRVIDACLEFLLKDKTHLQKKPFNLIRKIKIRNRLHHYSFKSYSRPYTLSQPKNKKNLPPLTVIIPTLNEIHNIEEVIASVDFADEIFVIDSYSTDGTYEKAKALANKVMQREFTYYADQKNWAIARSTHSWILLVDADERVTPALKHEIIDVLHETSKRREVAYWIGRKNHFMGREVRHSGWKNDKVIRLFKRDCCRYEDKHVHEEIVARGAIGSLQNKLYHNTYTNLDAYLQKMNYYAGLQAKDYDQNTGRLTGYHFVLKPLWRFFKHYIIQGGFRDGVVGLTIAYIQGYTVFMRYAKVWLRRNNRT